MAIMLFIFFLFLRPHTTAARNLLFLRPPTTATRNPFFLRPPTTTARNPLLELSADYLRRVAGYGDEKLSTVVVSGSLLCDACLDDISFLQSIPILGASMAVSCDTRNKTSISNSIKGKTDRYGDFLIDLPSHLHAVPNMEKRCTVRILDLPTTSPCHEPYNGQYRQIKLLSIKNGFRTYTTHNIHLTPKYPNSHACIKKW